MIQTVEKACLDCGVSPLGESLGRALADVYPSPYDQYRLTVSLGTPALWYQGTAHELLEALHALITADGAS